MTRSARIATYALALALFLTVVSSAAKAQATAPGGNAAVASSPSQGAALERTEEQSFSEMNHRIAGGFLIMIALCAFSGNLSDRFRWANSVWPFFFILPGVLLIFFSDPEVWPMGSQSWMTMLATNVQATQHKTYAFLLIGLGWLEFRRARGKLGPFTQTWGFPLLAIFGATLLFFHPHAEAQAAAPMAMPAAAAAHDHMAMEGQSAKKTAPAAASIPAKSASEHDHMAMGHDDKAAKPEPHEHDGKAAPAAPPADHDSMAGMKMGGEAGHGGHQDHSEHQRVKLQHLWFSIAGFGVALGKLAYDGRFWRSPITAAVWPVCMAVLGFLLIYYAE